MLTVAPGFYNGRANIFYVHFYVSTDSEKRNGLGLLLP